MTTVAWLHVLFDADAPDVYLAVVLDGRRDAVHGHYVLDLNKTYGLTD